MDDKQNFADAALAAPNRAHMLRCLLDGHARTATELAAVGEDGAAPEAMLVLAGCSVSKPLKAFEPSAPKGLREARRCYDPALKLGWLALLIQQAWVEAWVEGGLDSRALRIRPRGRSRLQRMHEGRPS